ncbi:MAG: hypothetical protein WD135_03615 [Ferruginibacter sp.]
MKYIIYFFVLATTLFSCSESKEKSQVTALDRGREFIRASLDGNFEAANALLLQDQQNIEMFQSYKIFYDKLPAEKKKGYKEASYEINKYTDVNDSMLLINYSNSYMHQPMDIKVVRVNNKWLIDFKYTSANNSSKE